MMRNKLATACLSCFTIDLNTTLTWKTGLGSEASLLRTIDQYEILNNEENITCLVLE